MKTDQSIIDGSRLIVEFMGSKYINDPYKSNKEDIELTDFWHWSKPESGWPRDNYTNQEYSTGFMIENWAYHKSWDWLMPIVEKIETTNVKDEQVYLHTEYDNRVEFLGWYSQIDLGIKDLKDLDTRYKTKIESCFNAVVWFIRWYNKNKK